MFFRAIVIATFAIVTMIGVFEAHATSSAIPDSQSTWQDPGWRRTIARYSVVVEADGSSRTVLDFAFRALDEAGARAIAQKAFSYDSYFDAVSLSDLATVKADGRVVPVDARAVGDQAAVTDTSYPYFDERRVLFAAFPDVAAGDTIRGRLVKTSKRLRFDGDFAEYWIQPANEPPGIIDLTLDVPAAKPVQIVAHGVLDEEARIRDRIIHHVKFTQGAPKRLSDGLDGFDGAQRFEASTFKDYAALAAMLNARNAPMAAPDEAVTRLSASIVGDASTPRAKVKRIYDWVARNIRYVGLGFQNGGLTSQPASAVLAARYGDCKAHVTVLKALLAAQGIAGEFIVVNSEPRYTLTEAATPNFDHAIAYVPDLGLYLDPTASSIPFGTVPQALYGKPVLNIDHGTLATIPVIGPDDFAITATTDYVLRSDGTRQAHSVLSGSGLGDTVTRNTAASLDSLGRAQLSKDLLTAAGLAGTGTYKFPETRDLDVPFAIDASFEITSALDLKTPNLIRMLALTDPRPGPSQLASAPSPTGEFTCSSLRYDDTASLTLPENINLYQKPGDLSYTKTFVGQTTYGAVSGHAQVTRTARLNGHVVQSDNHLVVTFSAPVCPQVFADEIRTAFKTFDEFKHQPIGLTPNAVTHVVEGGSPYEAGLAAYRAGHYDRAIMLWLPLAERGDTEAQNQIGWVFQEGRGVAQDYSEAFRWFLRSAATGDFLGQSHLGYFYSTGLGVGRNDERAVLWYRRSAEQGFAYAQYHLAKMLAEGQGIARDPTQALFWYERAASQNFLDARTMLGWMYETGEGVEQSYDRAATWYRGAAEKGDGLAQLDLGLLYVSGHGVNRDYGAATVWFRKSAEHGFAGADYNLGLIYENGLGVSKNPAEASAWYTKAAALGHTGAIERLGLLSKGEVAKVDGIWGSLLRSVESLIR